MEETATTLATIEGLVAESSRLDGRLTTTDPIVPMPVAGSATTKEELVQRVADCIVGQANVESVLYYERDPAQPTAQWLKHVGTETQLSTNQMTAPLLNACAAACNSNSCQLHRREDASGPVVVYPIRHRGRCDQALCAVTSGNSDAAERVAQLLQLAAAEISVWDADQSAHRAEHESRSWTAILEMIARLEESEDSAQACQLMANQMQGYLECRQVVVALRKRNQQGCQVKAVSGFARFDRFAETVTAAEAALDEAILQNSVIRWPQLASGHRVPARAHERLQSALGAARLVSSPLYDDQGEVVGAWLIVDPDASATAGPVEEFMLAAQRPLGSCLRSVRRTRDGVLSTVTRKVAGRFPKRRFTLVGIGLALLALLLVCPRPHRIACDCQIQPRVRQYVAAPFDAMLEDTLVKAGDIVDKGDVVATLDGREVRLESAALRAEHSRTRRAWETYLSDQDFHEAQQAKLEMQRLELQLQVLERRHENLTIKSPIRGVVVHGDLDKSRGMPVSLGQSLFEIAPLQQMTVEISVLEEDIAYVDEGMQVRIRLDAYPRKILDATVARVVPRAEAGEEHFRFLAEADIENHGELLRPGMNGRATLVAPHRTVGWLVFHKPYESLLMMLGW